MLGKKYSINVSKLLRRNSINDAKDIQEDKSYFCSELVASAYKAMDILPQEIAASTYWPVHFAADGGLMMVGEAYFDDELLIDWNL